MKQIPSLSILRSYRLHIILISKQQKEFKMKTLWITALIVTGALAVGQGNMMPSFSDFDTDGNGQVTKSEFENTRQQRMEKQAELGKMMRNAGKAPSFESIDTNNDGVIGSEEFSAHQSSIRKGGGQGMGRGQGMGQGMNR